jgi:thiosulfate/3-mercaptopyruvate sulfurtransferase
MYRIILIIFIFFALAGDLSWAAESRPLVDVAWLKPRVCAPSLVVLDLRRSPANYRAGHIPCAVNSNYYGNAWRIDIGGIAKKMPPVARLEALIGGLGISNDSHVVITGAGTDPFDAAEAAGAYLTLRYLGHDRVSILDGGQQAWAAEWDADIDTGPREPTPKTFRARPRPNIVAPREAVQAARARGAPLVDMRGHDHFLGVNTEAVLARLGTIAGARNMPMSWITKGGSLWFRSLDTLKTLFAAAGVPESGETIFFCNAGLESSLGWFVAHELMGNTAARLYDGSLAEWSADPTLPMDLKVPLK